MTALDVSAVLRRLARLAEASGADEGQEVNPGAYELARDAWKAEAAVAELIAAVRLTLATGRISENLPAALAACGVKS